MTEPKTPPWRFFIADLHLDGTDSPRALAFRSFLERLAKDAGEHPVELYILGDLFEFWYEYRPALFEIYRNDLNALESAHQAGVKIFVLHGNRDFAYGRYSRKRFGACVLGDGQRIVLSDSKPVWLEHGDLLCTADKRYLRFRGVMRSFPVRMLFFLMPWAIARGIVRKIQSKSAHDKAAKPPETFAIDHAAARRRLEQHDCRLLLCGHTHRAENEDLGAGYRLIVLPPWCERAAGYLDDGKGFRPFERKE